MRSPRLEQGLFLFSFVCSNMAFVVCLGVVLTINDKLFIVNILTLLFVAVWVAAATVIFKTSPADLYMNRGPHFVNTAAGPRREDIENGHPARAAGGGVLLWKPSVISPSMLSMIPIMLLLLSLFKSVAFIVTMLLSGTGLVPFKAVLVVSDSGQLMMQLMSVGAHVLFLLVFVAVIKRKNGLKGAHLSTVVYALLAGNFVLFMPASSGTPKVTFLDPVSGRVRRVFRESDEDFVPSEAKAGAWAGGFSASAAGS